MCFFFRCLFSIFTPDSPQITLFFQSGKPPHVSVGGGLVSVALPQGLMTEVTTLPWNLSFLFMGSAGPGLISSFVLDFVFLTFLHRAFYGRFHSGNLGCPLLQAHAESQRQAMTHRGCECCDRESTKKREPGLFYKNTVLKYLLRRLTFWLRVFIEIY